MSKFSQAAMNAARVARDVTQFARQGFVQGARQASARQVMRLATTSAQRAAQAMGRFAGAAVRITRSFATAALRNLKIGAQWVGRQVYYAVRRARDFMVYVGDVIGDTAKAVGAKVKHVAKAARYRMDSNLADYAHAAQRARGSGSRLAADIKKRAQRRSTRRRVFRHVRNFALATAGVYLSGEALNYAGLHSRGGEQDE